MMELRFLTQEDKPRAAALWQARFGDPEAFTAWYFQNRFLPEHSVGLFEKDLLISMAHGTPISLRMRHRVLPAMLVSGVATIADRERQGHMRRVMAEMLRHARACGCAAVLLKPAVPGVYDALGFVPCSDSLRWQGRMDTAPALPAVEATVKELTDCYAKIMHNYSMSVVRDENAFGRKLAENACDGGRVLAVANGAGLVGSARLADGTRLANGAGLVGSARLADGTRLADGAGISGYALYHEEGDGCRLTEVVADAAGAPALLQHFSARYAGQISAKLLPDAGISRELSAALLPGVDMQGERVAQNALTLVNVPMALGAILGDADIKIGVSGSLIAEDNAVFDGKGNTIVDGAGDAACGGAHYRLSIGQLSQALCGYVPLGDLLPSVACCCVDEY